jgi:hypothetical protein
MAARLKIIRIPRTPTTAFDKHRAVSDLVKNQVRHAYQELHAWWERIGRIAPDDIQTEQEAADYVRAVTRVLHPEATQRTPMPAGRPPKSGVSLGVPKSPRPAARPRSRSRRRAR